MAWRKPEPRKISRIGLPSPPADPGASRSSTSLTTASTCPPTPGAAAALARRPRRRERAAAAAQAAGGGGGSRPDPGARSGTRARRLALHRVVLDLRVPLLQGLRRREPLRHGGHGQLLAFGECVGQRAPLLLVGVHVDVVLLLPLGIRARALAPRLEQPRQAQADAALRRGPARDDVPDLPARPAARGRVRRRQAVRVRPHGVGHVPQAHPHGAVVVGDAGDDLLAAAGARVVHVGAALLLGHLQRELPRPALAAVARTLAVHGAKPSAACLRLSNRATRLA